MALNETKAEKERKANVLGRVNLISSVFNDYDRDTSFESIVVRKSGSVKVQNMVEIVKEAYFLIGKN